MHHFIPQAIQFCLARQHDLFADGYFSGSIRLIKPDGSNVVPILLDKKVESRTSAAHFRQFEISDFTDHTCRVTIFQILDIADFRVVFVVSGKKENHIDDSRQVKFAKQLRSLAIDRRQVFQGIEKTGAGHGAQLHKQ